MDNQTDDWITITSTGTGTMLFGTLNVGVQGLTNAGNLTIDSGGLLNANLVGVPPGSYPPENELSPMQGTATIKVGPQINLFGGRMLLNQDTVNVLGRTENVQQGELNVSADGEVQSINSDIRVNGTVSIRGSGTLFHQAGSSGSLTFSDELAVRSGAAFTSDDNSTGALGSATISASGTAGPGGLARGDIIVDGSTMNLFGGTVDITAGTSGALRLAGGKLDVSGTDVNVHGFEAYGGSTASVHNGADVQASGSAVIREGSTLNVDNTSRFTMGGDLRVNTGGQTTIRNDIAPHNAFIENPGSLLDIADSTLDATLGSVIVNDRATYNHNVGSLTTATSFEIRDFSTANLTDVDVSVGQNFTVTNGPTGGSTYHQTGGILEIGTNWDVFGGSGATLTDVDLTSSDFGLIHNSSSFVQSGGSISTGGRFQVDNSNASLTNVDLTTGAGAGVILSNGAIYTQSGGKIDSGEILRVGGSTTTANLTDVHLILSSDLQVLDGASYTQENTTSNSALNVGGALRVTGGAGASLRKLDVGAESVSVENAGSTLSITDGSLTTTGNRIFLTDNASYTHDRGALSSFSSLEVRDGSMAELTDVAVTVGQNMTVTDGASGGSSYTQTGGTLSVGTGWDVYGGSSMTLTDVALTSDEAGLIQNGSSYSHTGGSITTGKRFEVNASTATLDNVAVETQNSAGIIVANGATFGQSGGSLSSAEILRIDGGTSTATVENADVSTATNLQVLNGASYTQTNNALTLGGNLEVSGGSSATLNNVSASSNYADVGAGSGLDVTGGSLDVKTKLTVGGALGRYDQSAGAILSFGDEIFVLDGATLKSDSSSILQSGTGRGDVLVTNGSTLDLDGSTFDNTAGSSGWLTINGGILQADATSTLNVGGLFLVQHGGQASLLTDLTAESVSVENAGSTLSITDGSLTTMGNRIFLTDNATYTHTRGALNSFSSLEVRDGSMAELTDVAVTVGQNMTVTDGTSGGSSYTQTRGTLSIGTGWDVSGGSSMELTDVALTSGEAGLIQNGSSYSHTGGSLTTGQRFEVNASTATLDGVVVMTQNGAGIILANGATFDQSGGSLSSAEILRIDGGTSTATVENADVSTATNLQVLNGASYTQTNNALTLGGNLEVSGGSSATLNNVSASSYYADVGAGSGLDVTGGSLDVKTKLTVGGAGARLVIQSGGVVTSEGADINGGATATVQGSDSSWTSQLVNGRRDFGVNDGKLEVLGGAKVEVSSGSTVIGRGVDASGEVLVSGPGSTFGNTGAQGDLIVGFEGGTGRLTVEEGGQVQSAYASIGQDSGSVGEAVVTGTGSKWTATTIGIGGGGATGTLTVTDSGLVDADDIFVYEDGNLCGSGNVDANVQVMGGTICPGNSPGMLNILGNFILDSGILEIQVGGLSSGDYDVLNVTGNAYLNGGTILFSFINGFLPDEGDYLPFLTAGGEITIDSNNVIYAYEGAGPGFLFAVESGTGGLIFRAENDATSGVPAPGTLWLLGVGIAAGLRCSRRRAA